MEQADITGHPWEHILRDWQGGSMNLPGGLIKRVVQAFERQLTPDGVFVCADVAETEQYGEALVASGVSGVAERYKVEHYHIAKRVLEEVYGLRVDFATLGELTERFMPDEELLEADPRELEDIAKGDVVIMTVRRKLAQEV